MRTPKPPIGFVPVDSEEARKIDDKTVVNVCLINNGVWQTTAWYMRDCRVWITKHIDDPIYVQLPPPVEWEEVWKTCPTTIEGYVALKRNDDFKCVLEVKLFTEDELNTIVAALNQMEVGNGGNG